MTGRMEVLRADVAALAVDAVVTAANEALCGGGGVDGAVHRAAGPELLAACRALGGCPTGEARITPGFALPAKHVIHAVGPVWRGGAAGEDALLASCYRSAMALAAAHGLASIAFPAISTGAYLFPPARAAGVAVGAVAEALARPSSVERVVFACFGAESTAFHEAALASSRASSA